MRPDSLVQLLFVVIVSGQMPPCLKSFTPSSREPVDLSVSQVTCHLSNRSNVPVPPPNYRACFRTCIQTFQNRTRVCEADDPTTGVSIEPLSLIRPSDPALQDMYFTTSLTSPGFFTNKQYRNSAICRYNVQCDPGQLLHFLISSFSTEKRYGSTCLDTVTIDRSAYGTKKTICGGVADIGADIEDFNDGRLYVDFTTNRVVQDSGFYIAVTCVRPQFYNQPFSFMAPPLHDFGFRRKRSGLKTATHPPPPPPFYQPFMLAGNPPHDYSHMPTNLLGDRSKRSFRVVTITIPTGMFLVYDQKIIRVCRGGYGLYRFDSIDTLQVYNRAEGYIAFYDTAGTRQFPGLAQLFIGFNIVQLIQYGVDNQFRLNINDQDGLHLLYQELYRLGVFMNDDFTIDDFGDPYVPYVPKPPPVNINITELAYVYSRSNNGVLRAAACLYRDRVLQKPCTSSPYA
ncbi:hypothetical protein EMCRGX_G022696 [Ephydatia muelleri]